MQINRASALALIYRSERGYSNHSRDPGGPTQDGITLRTLSAWRGHTVTIVELRALPQAEREEIYSRQYLDPIHFDDLPAGVDYCCADAAVNSGSPRAGRLLQEALGFTERDVDGMIGEQTLTAAKAVTDLSGLINGLCDLRLAFLRKLDTWDVFGTGWTRRVEAVRTEALAFARGTTAPAAAPERESMPATATAKADGATKVTRLPSGQSALATLGSVAGVAVVAAGQATGMLQPYSEVHVVRYLLIGLAVIGATATFLQALTRARGGAVT